MIDNKKKQVFEILLMPIECTRYSKEKVEKVEIERKENIIESTQTYYPCKKCDITLDEDMSDFAIGFYEIIYNKILNGNSIINKDNDSLCDSRYAGDTMNSFETIANRFPEAGKSKKNRTPQSSWPNILKEYKRQYHCLANFWLIPSEIGRTIDKMNELCKGSYTYGIKDYMDRFLKKLLEKENKIKDYFSVDSFIDFANIHFLNGSYTYADSKIYNFSDDNMNGEYVIERIIDRMRLRATLIANSEYSGELWEYFNGWDLIK